MLEFQMLSAAMMNRGCYNLIDKYIESKELSPEAQRVLGVISEYYGRDQGAEAGDREIIREAVLAGIPDHNDKHKELLGEFIKRIPNEVSVDNVSDYIIGIKRERLRGELHQQLLSKASDGELEKSLDKWRELRELSTDDTSSEEIRSAWDVEDLVGIHFEAKNLIKFLPVGLNKQLDGGAKPGHHILVYAFTEVGKTLFTINLVYGFLKQNLRVLYVANEEPIADLNMRLVNRFTGMTKNEVRENPKLANERLAGQNYSGFTIAGLSPGSFADIQDISKSLDPHVIVLDQLGNLDVGVADGKTQQLNKAAQMARSMGKRDHRLMVSIAQASNDAYNRPELRINDVQWSNVDLPGHMDAMFGVGATEEMLQAGLRRLAKPKNKISGCHRTLDMRFIPELSKVEELYA